MHRIADIADYLDRFAAPELAADWDNTGLLVGNPESEAQRIMTCLTITPETVAEAVQRQANLIVTHHPLPFHPLRRITTGEPTGQMLWDLIRAGISVYSPHTRFDSATDGINSQLARRLGLVNVQPIQPAADDGKLAKAGAGRIGSLGTAVAATDWLMRVKQEFRLETLQWSGEPDWVVRNVAIACGSGGSLLNPAIALDCDAFLTGETSFHTCLAARAAHVVLVTVGHFNSERFGVEWLADHLREKFDRLIIWASEKERDPVRIS